MGRRRCGWHSREHARWQRGTWRIGSGATPRRLVVLTTRQIGGGPATNRALASTRAIALRVVVITAAVVVMQIQSLHGGAINAQRQRRM